MPSDIETYLQLGIDLTNKYVNLNERFAGWPANRKAILKVCRASKDVEFYVPDWLRQHANDMFSDEAKQQGKIAEELFSLYLKTDKDPWQIVLDKVPVQGITVEVFVPERTFWDLAAMTETIYSAFITGKQVIIKGDYKLRDMVHLDRLIETIHSTLLNQGINITEIARPA